MNTPTSAPNWRTPFVILLAGTTIVFLSLGARMTFGLWSKDVVKAAAVKDRAARLDPDVFDDDDEIETVCRAIGMTNTMVWQFYPGE